MKIALITCKKHIHILLLEDIYGETNCKSYDKENRGAVLAVDTAYRGLSSWYKRKLRLEAVVDRGVGVAHTQQRPLAGKEWRNRVDKAYKAAGKPNFEISYQVNSVLRRRTTSERVNNFRSSQERGLLSLSMKLNNKL